MEANKVRYYHKVGRIAASLRLRVPSVSADETLVSVIIRMKDRPNLLARDLTCPANQTQKYLEVVLVKDGRQDE